jgi:hypothetical protein
MATAAAAAAALASPDSQSQHDRWDRGDDEPQNVEFISSSPLDVQPPVAKSSVTLSLAQLKEMCRGRWLPCISMNFTHPSIHPSIHPCKHTCKHANIHTYIHKYIHTYFLSF